jgi:hypothetical protein
MRVRVRVSTQLHLCASDGEVASEAVVSMFITASKPLLVRQPTLSIIEIPGMSSSCACAVASAMVCAVPYAVACAVVT